MRSTRSFMVVSAAALALVLAAGSATAQSSISLRADIPFEFTAAGKTMPAGEYSLRSLAPPEIVAISATDGGAQALLLTQGAASNTVSDQSKLLFRKYGDRYFLAEVWSAGSLSGQRLPVSKAERELTKRAANFEVVAVLTQR